MPPIHGAHGHHLHRLYVGLNAVGDASGGLPGAVFVYDTAADEDAVPIRKITMGIGNVAGIALDSDGNVYVSASDGVRVYDPAGDAAPVRTIKTGGRLAIDSSDNLYALSSNNAITVYRFGADGNALPIRTLTGIRADDIFDTLSDIAIDNFDYLYLSSYDPGLIRVYAPRAHGSAAPIRTISSNVPSGVPSGMGFDAANNLYVIPLPYQSDLAI